MELLRKSERRRQEKIRDKKAISKVIEQKWEREQGGVSGSE